MSDRVDIIKVQPTASAVASHWREIAPLITDALAYCRQRFVLGEIRDKLERGRMSLWVFVRAGQIIGAVVTVNTDFSTLRLCTILLCGGEDIDAWADDGLRAIERQALAEGCRQVEIVGRPGWRRKCAGYEHAGDWLVKDLARVQEAA